MSEQPEPEVRYEAYVNPIWKYIAVCCISFMLGAAIPSYISFVMIRDTATKADLSLLQNNINQKFDTMSSRLNSDEEMIGAHEQWEKDQDSKRR